MNETPTFDEGREALAWVANAFKTRETNESISPYLDAAAVLSTFRLETIQPVGLSNDLLRVDALIELTERSHPVREQGIEMWQLDDSVRRATLRRLGVTPAMRRARLANPTTASDPLQKGIDLLIVSNDGPNLDDLSLDELLGVERAARWLEGTSVPVPSAHELAARIQRERQLAPMRKLAGEGFINRKNKRAQLADYVGTLPAESAWQGLRRQIKYVAYWLDQRPPLHLHGPGGVGKSALLARFILDHASPQHLQPLPFVYLDFDRAALDPREPQTILEDSIRQLLIQFPWVDTDLSALGDEVRENVSRFDHVEVSKSGYFKGYENLVRRFCRLLEVIAEKNDQPVLIVLDTLEEAEYQGHSAMFVTWNLLGDLLQRVNRLRIVTAGRSALPPGLQVEPVELTGLSEDDARQLVIERTATLKGGPITDDDARSIIALVGTVPLSIMLAARIVINEGIEGLRDTVRRRHLFSRIRSEHQQGMLYRRILNHVRAHNPELEKVANPGLILRRITSDIIEHVLANACQLDLSGKTSAQDLFDELQRETGLVDSYREAGALWHLPAVRRIMLPDLRATLGDIPRQIHEAAAQYYHGRSGSIERAEEIYHLLWLGTDTSQLDALWSPDLEPYLRSAYEELEPNGKIWLGNKLGIELEEHLRLQADFSIWERQAEQRARTLMSSGLFQEALTALRERERSELPSPLYALEADVLKLMGRLDEARVALDKGLIVAEQAGDRGAMLPLILRQVFLSEAAGNLEDALIRATRAMDLAVELREPMESLSAGVAVLRVARKLKSNDLTKRQPKRKGEFDDSLPFGSFLSRVHEWINALVCEDQVRVALRSRPVLLKEVAAELGSNNKELLVEAVSLLGISSDDWLALIQYIKDSATALDDDLREFLASLERRTTSRGMGQEVAKLVPQFSDFFVRQMARSVEEAIQQSIHTTSIAKPHGGVTNLSAKERTTLQRLIVGAFTREELQLLMRDSFDVDLGAVTSPSAAFEPQVHDLLRFVENNGALDKLVGHLARSRPGNHALGRFVKSLRNWTDRFSDQVDPKNE